jgi:ABC-2 type transport system permease protein
MSALDSAPAVPAPSTRVTLVALYRVLLRMQISVARILGIAALGAVSVALGVFSRFDDEPAQAAADAVASYGLGLVVPLAALWLGSAAIGDLVEDRLLVYLWLKPVSRWQLPAAAVLATASVVVPLTALPVAASALAAGESDVALAALGAAILGGLAYSSLFVAAGVWFKRAAWWGLAFVLVWENAVAYTAEGAARFTIFGWSSSILGDGADVEVPLEAGSTAVAVVVLVAITVAGWLVASYRYARADID